MKLEILHDPDPRLRVMSQPVQEVTPWIQDLLDRMLDVMYEQNGVGLAAPQVNHALRMVVMDVQDGSGPIKLINPDLSWVSPTTVRGQEGCLSVPGFAAHVTRPDVVKVRYVNEWGEAAEKELSELAAKCIQHEIDHLNGVLFVDRLSRLDLMLRRKQMSKMPRSRIAP
jgi:peptide deformylase